MDGQKHQKTLLLTNVLIIICHPQDYLDYLDYCMSYPGSGLLVVHQMYEQENFYIRPFIVIGNLSLSYLVFLSSVKTCDCASGTVIIIQLGPV